NKDGRPDFNNIIYNVAANAGGQALDTNGNADGDANFDVTKLAYGTSFGIRAHGLQGEQQEIGVNSELVWQLDAAGNQLLDANGNPIPKNIFKWTNDPRQNPFDTTPSTDSTVFNGQLSDSFAQFMLDIWKTKALSFIDNAHTQYGGVNPATGAPANQFVPQVPNGSFAGSNYTDDAGFYHELAMIDALNAALLDANYKLGYSNGGPLLVKVDPVTGKITPRDGGAVVSNLDVFQIANGTGVIEGTPTALITETEIDQVGTGGSLQLNWNLEKHKFMVGGSVDKADANYASAEYLGLLDSKRNGRAAPDLLGYEFITRDKNSAVRLNDFSGDSITSSLYTSETWTPVKTLSLTASARYNYTTVSNQLAVNRNSGVGAGSLQNFFDYWGLCSDINNDGVVDALDCPTGVSAENILNPTGINTEVNRSLIADARETFKYRSFNPSLGATWQANEDLNVYANWNKGARTPTVIELGCAYDGTLIAVPGTNPVQYRARSLVERRTCNLPSTMSGDPYLKQVRSQTFELGARGNWTNDLEWNASVYRTDLQDDIYFVSVAPSRSYFQNIGDTRRQGLEMGVKAKIGKAKFGLNYSLTDANFKSDFNVASPYNSSADTNEIITVISNGQPDSIRNPNFQQIKVNSGNRMPGIPLHNLNANFSYDFTNKWTVGLSAVMHSSAFARGNENNQHKAGAATPVLLDCVDPVSGSPSQCLTPRADWGSGKTAGYTVFNFQTSYKFNPEWTLGMQINNLFDKEYASAGRLGLNAFSKGQYGLQDASGFNYNSSEWQGTSFLGLGAPRSAYFTLTYQFASDEKSSTSEAEAITVDLPLPSRPLDK
ncbi:MAG: TonB-dependent receptor, partial [Methylotenera sp.]